MIGEEKTVKDIAALITEDQRKVVIMGGVHGDDRLGLEVVTHYFHHNNPLFQLILANHKAVEKKKKFIDFDLIKAGKGDLTCTTSIEKCRAAEIHEVLEQYDYVVDVHGNHFNEDIIILTDNSKETLEFAKTLGIKRGILIEKNNYLIESVPHAITLICKVEAKLDPTNAEVANTVLMLNKLEKYFVGQKAERTQFDLYTLTIEHDNQIDWILNNDITDSIIPVNN